MSKNFPERLRQLRRSRQLSQQQLAKMCRLSQSAISNYENGTRKVAREIFILARVLNVSPLWLAEGQGPKEPTLVKQQSEPQASAYETTYWPFKWVQPEALHRLSAGELALVENTLLALLQSLEDSDSSDSD
ncbi:MAG TPA: helix-turn-helix transcriptional regulator [Paenalcaligenes sp.]|nr:helix-turn-helix transcriptional regulator [Paenalcaligenes sp.]